MIAAQCPREIAAAADPPPAPASAASAAATAAATATATATATSTSSTSTATSFTFGHFDHKRQAAKSRGYAVTNGMMQLQLHMSYGLNS